MVVDLIVMDMPDFDIILGMDFLGKYGAKIDFKKKKIWFNLDNGEQFNFLEGWVLSIMISSVKANKMLSKECLTYLMHIINK